MFQGVHMVFEAGPQSRGLRRKFNKLIFIGRNLDKQALTEGFVLSWRSSNCENINFKLIILLCSFIAVHHQQSLGGTRSAVINFTFP